MKNFFKFTISICITVSVIYASTWQSVGLDSLKINCLIEVYQTVIAGTEKGLYFLDNDSLRQWIKYSGVPSLPIQDIITAGNGELIVSAGNGSNSDGIYGGLGVYDGAPFYEFSRITFFDFPEALGYHNDTLLVGSKNSLNYAVRDSVQSLIPGIFFKPFQPISIPNNSFGVEDPVVSDIYYSNNDVNFIVAGYDKSPEPASGSLLSTTTKSSKLMLDSSTTSIYEQFEGWSMVSNIYIGGLNALYKSQSNLIFNTKDLNRNRYSTFEKISTPNNGKVNHVTGVMPSPIIIDGAADICIATNEGVFLKDYNDNWTEYGDIGEIPNMIVPVFKTIYNGSTPKDIGYIYAATDKGVHRYNFYDSTPISFKDKKSTNLINNISIDNNILEIKCHKNNINNIVIFNIAGKTIFKSENLNTKNLKLNLEQINISSGTYLINIKNAVSTSKYSINYIR